MFLHSISRPLASAKNYAAQHAMRAFTKFNQPSSKQLPPHLVVPESDLQEAFLKGSGPGGQKINKTSSAVQLKHLPTGIVVKSQATRSRSQNRKIARTLLSEKLEFIEKGRGSRIAIKEEAQRKKKASKAKKARRKHRVLVDSESRTDEIRDAGKLKGRR